MSKDKIRIYAMEIILLLFLFLALFESNIVSKIVLAVVLLMYMFVSAFLLKKRKVISMYNKQVSILLVILALIYLAIFYLLGLYFGFYPATVKFSLWSLFKYIIPMAVIIVSSEVIRYIFTSQPDKFSKAITMIIMVLVDLSVYTTIYDVSSVTDVVTVLGFVLFASISCNLLYNYIVVRFGYKGIILYRLITVLYVYFIPIIPNVYLFFRSFFRMVYPFFIYLLLEYTYSKTNFAIPYEDKRNHAIGTALLLFVACGIIMLISGQFRFGALVVGSGSMSGKINKGDILIYERYDKQELEVGEVIVFKKAGVSVVHRIIDIKIVNNETRYITKGDANQVLDEGYITDSDILGVSLFRFKYLGYPTIWLHEMF